MARDSRQKRGGSRGTRGYQLKWKVGGQEVQRLSLEDLYHVGIQDLKGDNKRDRMAQIEKGNLCESLKSVVSNALMAI